MPLVERRAVDAVPFAAPRARSRRPMSPFAILATIFACLIVGHLAIAAYFPSMPVNAIGVMLVVAIIGSVLYVKNDVFAALLIIFFCSQFAFANNQGGLFNLVAFLLFLPYLVLKPPVRETPGGTDGLVLALVVVLIVSDLLGLMARSPLPLEVVGLEAAAFIGFMLAFHFASSLKLTEVRLRQFLIVAGFMAVYNFFVSVNQHYGAVLADTPLLGLTRDLFYASTNAFGTFASASANGQYAMMLLALILPLLAASASRTALKLRPIQFVPTAVMCALTLILANMRAAALESVLIVIIYTIIFTLMSRRAFRNAKYVHMASAAVVVVLATVGVWFNLENIADDFRQVRVKDTASLESGEALNRYGPWQYGWQRLQSGSWWLGYGHGNDLSNSIAWGGHLAPGGREAVAGGHLHNLYLALPMMFGWFGAVAYLMLFFVVIWRLYRAVRRHSLTNITTVACLGFLMSLFFFMVDEVKSGNAVQTINYAMVMWIWLGLGLAAWRTQKADAAEARARRYAESAPAEAAAAPEEGDEALAEGEPGA